MTDSFWTYLALMHLGCYLLDCWLIHQSELWAGASKTCARLETMIPDFVVERFAERSAARSRHYATVSFVVRLIAVGIIITSLIGILRLIFL